MQLTSFCMVSMFAVGVRSPVFTPAPPRRFGLRAPLSSGANGESSSPWRRSYHTRPHCTSQNIASSTKPTTEWFRSAYCPTAVLC